MSNLINQSLGRYHILEQLGEGGMAIVYKAYDTRLERDVAVKVIRTEKLTIETMGKTLKRFEREAKALAKLTHPNIVPITDYGEHEDKPYLVMPHLPGGTLKQLLKGKPMPWEDAVRLLIPIARALHYAHQQGIIHRDVKPSNILITQSGEPMLTDFGIAKILIDTDETADLTGTGMGVGTPEYMSPEQFQGKGVDARTDIYSLGVLLYEIVTGRKPYQADTPAAVLIKQATDPLPRPKGFIPDLPDTVERILLKALSKGVDDRYQSMSEFGSALDGLIKQSVPDKGAASVGRPESLTSQESPTPVKPSVSQLPSLWKRWVLIVIPVLILGISWFFGREFIKPPLESFGSAAEKSTNTPEELLTNTPAVTVVPSRTPTSTSPKTASSNLALNKTATSNVSPCDSSESSRKAVNGTWNGGLSDKWCAYNNGTLWWQVDLISNYRINKVVIYHAGAGGETLDYNTRNFNIQVSVNGTQWETVANISDNKSSITTHMIVPVDARYIRLVVLRGEQSEHNTARIYEVQVFGDKVDSLNKEETIISLCGAKHIENFLNEYNVVFYNDFSENMNGLESWGADVEVKNGSLINKGYNFSWKGVGRPQKMASDKALLVRYRSNPPNDFKVYIEQGEYGKPDHRVWGISSSDNNIEPFAYFGQAYSTLPIDWQQNELPPTSDWLCVLVSIDGSTFSTHLWAPLIPSQQAFATKDMGREWDNFQGFSAFASLYGSLEIDIFVELSRK
jgi:serine/threonine protein kinase